jgi:hypothetical protein
LWIATGVVVQISSVSVFSGCGATDNVDDFFDLGDVIANPVTCQENSVVEAFAFLNGLICTHLSTVSIRSSDGCHF